MSLERRRSASLAREPTTTTIRYFWAASPIAAFTTRARRPTRRDRTCGVTIASFVRDDAAGRRRVAIDV